MSDTNDDVVIVTVERDTNENGNMREMARDIEKHYTQPSPKATTIAINLFPAPVIWGLVLGALLGGVLGGVFGTILHNGTLVIAGSEGMFSLFPNAFILLWIGIGVALGVLVIGIAAVFVSPVPTREYDETHT